jgi:DNA polymerase-3 subunit alpha
VLVHPGLTVLNRTVALIQEGNGLEEISRRLPDNDERTIALLCRGETEDIDQFRTSRAQELLLKLKPEGIDDLAIACSLSHEVQFKNRVASEYLEQRASQGPSSYPHPWLKDILGETHGVLLYHEQVMGIVHRLGGLELRDGLKLLKAVCKSSQEQIDSFRGRFVAGAEEKQIDPGVANSIFDLIVRGAGHTTCKANNTITATIAYQLAYLKANHAEAFTAADAEGTYAAFDEALLADLKAHHPEAIAATDAA